MLICVFFREVVSKANTYKSFEDIDDCFRIEDDLKFTHDETKSSLDEIFNVDNYSNVDSDEVMGDEVRFENEEVKMYIFTVSYTHLTLPTTPHV